MAFATQEDVEARLRRDLTSAEEPGVAALLDDASAVVVGFCGQDFSSPYPSAVVGVTAKMVARVLSRGSSPGGEFVDQQNSGPFGVRYSAATSSGDVWLTAADKLALRPYRLAFSSVQLVGERCEIDDDEES